LTGAANPFLLGGPITEQEREAQEDAKREAEIIAAGWRRIIETVEGRAALHHLLAFCGVNRTSFTGQALSMALLEGKQEVGRYVMAQAFAVDPALQLRMIKDHDDRKRRG
jgi:hypothetical protein